jgi:hypothetical protein
MVDINGYIFPDRVWEKSKNGWYSRECTKDDDKRRALLVKELESANRNGTLEESKG